ncbi:hypothetical protein BCR36DRAFT_352283 [Piromyces finnis]|uniref:Chitin-binding type-1 domain-containing protein n=1 Tax=Piromyces finnis TaxID=1754191 RepID=A0A1Y1V917_9FUNG|nr:hypothetical protein BCR36DRAFT_352283 [Piromyces finnis]|eukprot:ORX50278.1 hypothetical protein BCR36DRAFT_352283 [Piromyces finnis]
MNEIKELEYTSNNECSNANLNKIQYSINIDKNKHFTSNFKICLDVTIYIDDSTKKIGTKDEFNKCSTSIKKYEINENGVAFAFSCGNFNENKSEYAGNYLLNDQLYNCITIPNLNTIKTSCYELKKRDGFNEIKIFKKQNFLNDNYLYVELRDLFEIQDIDIENIGLFDCFKNKCTKTTGFFKYNIPTSIAKCTTTNKCQIYTSLQNECDENNPEVLQVRYDNTTDTLQYCDEFNHFSPMISNINIYVNLNNNQPYIKVKPDIIGLSQYSITLPTCSSINENSSCKTGINENVETCIDTNGRIYKNRSGKCFLYYGYINNENSIRIFQKGSQPNNFFEVTSTMNNIIFNSYETQPYFVVYDCFNNKCVQSSAVVRYTLRHSMKKNPDEFIRCSSTKPTGCQKIKYAFSDECSGTQSHPNEGKIIFTPVSSKTNNGVLQICMDTNGKASGNKKLEFVSIFTNYIIENNFGMTIGQTLFFPDTIPEQKVFMKVTYNAIVMMQGLRLHQVGENGIDILNLSTIKSGYYWGSNKQLINCNKAFTNTCESIRITNFDCYIVGTLSIDLDNNYKYCIKQYTAIELPDDIPHYYPLILNSTYNYGSYISNIPDSTNNGLLNVTRTSITQVIEKEIYVDDNNIEVSIKEFEKCDSPIQKYQCNSNGYCHITSCCNVGIDKNCISDFYLYNNRLYNCIDTPIPENINFSCIKEPVKESFTDIVVFKKNEKNDIWNKMNRFDKLTDKDIPHVLIYDCAKAKCIPTSGYIRYNNNNSLAKCTIKQCEVIKNPYLSTCEKYSISYNNECGPSHNNTICGNSQCCNTNGICGTTTSFCNDNCLSEFGKCKIDNTLYSTYNIIQARLNQSQLQFCDRNHNFNNITDSNNESFFIIEDKLSFVETKKNLIALVQNGINLPYCYYIYPNDACRSNINTYVDSCIYNNIIYTNNKENKCTETYGKTSKAGIKIFQKGSKSYEFTDVTNNLKEIKITTNEINPFFLLYNCTNSGCKHYTSNYKFDISDTIEKEFICSEKEYACYLLNIDYTDDKNYANKNGINYKYLHLSTITSIIILILLHYCFIII